MPLDFNSDNKFIFISPLNLSGKYISPQILRIKFDSYLSTLLSEIIIFHISLITIDFDSKELFFIIFVKSSN